MFQSARTNNSMFRTKYNTDIANTSASKTITSFIRLQNNVGSDVTAILNAFTIGSTDLNTLLEYARYTSLAGKILSYTKNGTDTPSITFEFYRRMIVAAIEAAKIADIRQEEHAIVNRELQSKYDELLKNNTKHESFIGATETLNIVANVRPEVIEYIKRGHPILDAEGRLIQLDMDVIAKIRRELNL